VKVECAIAIGFHHRMKVTVAASIHRIESYAGVISRMSV
jgi:hypothetical protein